MLDKELLLHGISLQQLTGLVLTHHAMRPGKRGIIIQLIKITQEDLETWRGSYLDINTKEAESDGWDKPDNRAKH